jgi:glucose-6-phosphate isomerase
MVNLDLTQLTDFISSAEIEIEQEKVKPILDELQKDPMAGWIELPDQDNHEELAQIQKAAHKIQQNSNILVCIGIGGSYLGAKAVLDVLGNHSKTEIVFTGNSLSPREFEKITNNLDNKDWSILVISKSGTTLEPAVAFKILQSKLIEKYGKKEASERIFAVTDKERGELKQMADENGYETFVIPDNIGGRYSVLTPVGLLPLAVAGINISGLISGADSERKLLLGRDGGEAATYAIIRYLLNQKSTRIEVLANFEPSFDSFSEWWKQLFGESEGKEHKGLFPASVIYTTDLHSMGQYLQEGPRDMLETFISVENTDSKYTELANLNKIAEDATIKAHATGKLPIVKLSIPTIDELAIGSLIYFFELSCAISAKLLGVNPFDQPGVEEYKKNIKQSLGE